MNVAIVGCGVRGSLVAALLAGAGVLELSLVDGASVEEADLGVHPLQFAPDLFAPKTEALAAKLGLINSDVHAEPFPAFVTEENAVAILTGADVAVDCASDDHTSPLIESAAAELGIPVVAPPAAYMPEAVEPAFAAAVGALQADAVLRLRDSGGGPGVIRVDGSAIA